MKRCKGRITLPVTLPVESGQTKSPDCSTMIHRPWRGEGRDDVLADCVNHLKDRRGVWVNRTGK